jgi:hypothetical protein
MDGGWPSLPRMEELLSHALAEITDSLLHDAVLEGDINTAKGKAMSLCAATVLEGVVRKTFIVAVVVKDADAMLLGKVLKCTLSVHCLFRGKLGH